MIRHEFPYPLYQPDKISSGSGNTPEIPQIFQGNITWLDSSQERFVRGLQNNSQIKNRVHLDSRSSFTELPPVIPFQGTIKEQSPAKIVIEMPFADLLQHLLTLHTTELKRTQKSIEELRNRPKNDDSLLLEERKKQFLGFDIRSLKGLQDSTSSLNLVSHIELIPNYEYIRGQFQDKGTWRIDDFIVKE